MTATPAIGTATAIEDTLDDRGLAQTLKLAAGSVEGILMRQVPGKDSALDREIYADIEASGTIRFKGGNGIFADSAIRFDAKTGRLDIFETMTTGTGQGARTIQFVRSGTDEALIRDYDPGSPYNRRVVELIAQILGLGLATEIVMGDPLPEAALLYLKPLPVPENSCDRLVETVIESIRRYRPKPIRDRKKFDEMYRRLIQRLVASGIQMSRLSATQMETTVQQELLCAMIKVDIWRKMWRWSTESIARVADMRAVPAVAADKDLSRAIRDMEAAVRKIAEMTGIYVANATTLYKRAVAGTDFYIEAMPAIVYVRDARPVVEEAFTSLNRWSTVWNSVDPRASLSDMTALLTPHADSVATILALPLPKKLQAQDAPTPVPAGTTQRPRP